MVMIVHLKLVSIIIPFVLVSCKFRCYSLSRMYSDNELASSYLLSKTIALSRPYRFRRTQQTRRNVSDVAETLDEMMIPFTECCDSSSGL